MAFEPKTEIIPIRVSPTQAKRLREHAEREGDRVSSWIRRLAVRHLEAEEAGAPEMRR